MEESKINNINEIDEELFILAADQILKDDYKYFIEELEEDYIDYEYLKNLDFEDLDDEYIEELLEWFLEEPENDKQNVKTYVK